MVIVQDFRRLLINVSDMRGDYFESLALRSGCKINQFDNKLVQFNSIFNSIYLFGLKQNMY